MSEDALGSSRSPAEDRRIAHHEAGHVAASWILGGRTGAVSIEPSRRWQGVAKAAAPRIRGNDLERADLSSPLVLWPTSVRRFLERGVLIDLCGREGEKLAPDPIPDGYQTLDEEELAAEKAVRALSGDDRRFLAAGDARERRPSDSDEWKAADGARLLCPEAGSVLLAHLRWEARRLASMPRFHRLVAALVLEMLAHRTLGSAHVRRILRAADSRGVPARP